MDIKVERFLSNVIEDVKKTTPLLFLQKINKNTYIINDYTIRKTSDFFDIYRGDKMILEGIIFLEAALAIVESIIKNVGSYSRIMAYEKEYSKYYFDYKYAENAYNKNKNKEVYEDKMFYCLQHMERLKNNIKLARTI